MNATIGYCRVSKEEQVREGLSLQDQRQAIERYCDLKSLGLPIILADEGISGTSLAKREQARSIILRMEAGEVGHVVATALDRLFRSTLDAVTFFALAKARGVSIHLIREALDTSTPIGEFTATIMAALAQLESRRTGERIRHVLAYKKQENGGHTVNGRAPYGWEWSGKGNNKKLQPNLDEQIVLTAMRRMRESGLGWQTIAHRLNFDPGFPPRHGGRWHRSQIRQILTRASDRAQR